MRSPLFFILAATLSLAACGGSGGGSSSMPSTGGSTGGSTQSSQQQSETAIDTANSVGDPVKTLTDFNQSTTGVQLASRTGHYVIDMATNTCVNGVEFFSPDKNGDPNSTEEQYFYDTACTELARDVVRVYTIDGTSETVNRTEKQYALNDSTPIAQRTSAVSFINGTYGANGFPSVVNGFGRSATSELDLSGTKTIADDDELVLSPSSTGVNTYCGDSAGYNASEIASLNETFGWEGQTSTGTRTINADGSITWQSTHTGFTAKGAIGSLSVNAGSANTACPISTPEYTLSGGTSGGNYSIPVTAQFMHGELVDLTVSNAQLASGNTLNVTTNTGVSPTNSQFITGTVSNGSRQIATFNVDTFGDGTLTVTTSGAQFVIDDWHVVK